MNRKELVIRRDRYLNILKRKMWNGSIKIITGVRRCGKSFLLNRLFRDYLLEHGVGTDHIIMFSIESLDGVRLRNPYVLDKEIRSKIIDDGDYYIFIDEIQLVNDFEDLLNGYVNNPKLDVYVTGSNSRFLSKDVITEFRGRGDEIRVHPLSFSEYLPVSGKDERSALREYMVFGGMPKIQHLNDEGDRMKYLSDLFTEIYLRDIIEKNRLRNDADIGLVTDVICSSVGSPINPKKIADTIRSVEKSSISRNTVVSHIDFLTDAFLFEESKRFDVRGRKYIGALSKFYCEDIGLRNARLDFRQNEPTHALENVIYNELRIRGFNVDVGIIRGNVSISDDDGKENCECGCEVDFVANKGDRRYYIQSCFSITDIMKKKREINGFKKIKDSFKKFLVTADDVRMSIDDDGIITVNIIDFLLNEDIFTVY